MISNQLKLICFLILLSGCVSVDTLPQHHVRDDIYKPKPIGVYHKVKKSETIWRIANAYNVTISEIVEANNIPNIAKIEINQLVFIPGATEVIDIYIDTSKTKDDFVWPIKGKILKYFHNKKSGVLSRGIDIKAQRGDLVKASRSGKVTFADYLAGQGYVIVVDHLDGYSTVYSKNAKMLVKYGDSVYKYDPIAHVGQQDKLTYLHFRIRKNNKNDNPLYYLP